MIVQCRLRKVLLEDSFLLVCNKKLSSVVILLQRLIFALRSLVGDVLWVQPEFLPTLRLHHVADAVQLNPLLLHAFPLLAISLDSLQLPQFSAFIVLLIVVVVSVDVPQHILHLTLILLFPAHLLLRNFQRLPPSVLLQLRAHLL